MDDRPPPSNDRKTGRRQNWIALRSPIVRPYGANIFFKMWVKRGKWNLAFGNRGASGNPGNQRWGKNKGIDMASSACGESRRRVFRSMQNRRYFASAPFSQAHRQDSLTLNMEGRGPGNERRVQATLVAVLASFGAFHSTPVNFRENCRGLFCKSAFVFARDRNAPLGWGLELLDPTVGH